MAMYLGLKKKGRASPKAGEIPSFAAASKATTSSFSPVANACIVFFMCMSIMTLYDVSVYS